MEAASRCGALQSTHGHMLVGSLQRGVAVAGHAAHLGLKIGSTRQIVKQRQLSTQMWHCGAQHAEHCQRNHVVRIQLRGTSCKVDGEINIYIYIYIDIVGLLLTRHGMLVGLCQQLHAALYHI